MNNYLKSSLFSYNAGSQAAAINDSVEYSNVSRTGVSIIQRTDSISEIRTPGLYQISFNVTGATSGTAGNIVLQLQQNGENIPGAIASGTSASATDLVNLSFTTVIRVNPNCPSLPDNVPTTLNIVNSGIASTLTNAAITIVRLA